MTERWLPVVGYEGAYEVSDEGRVRSLDRIIDIAPSWRTKGYARRQAGRMRVVTLDPGGYAQVGLSHGAVVRVHLLVLEAFVGPCPTGMECRHLDGNRANPRLSNLCWGTRKQNAADRIGHGTAAQGERNGNAKLTAPDVLKIRRDQRTKTAIAADYGISRSLVSLIHRGLAWSHV